MNLLAARSLAEQRGFEAEKANAGAASIGGGWGCLVILAVAAYSLGSDGRFYPLGVAT